jgi:hypothetical protein
MIRAAASAAVAFVSITVPISAIFFIKVITLITDLSSGCKKYMSQEKKAPNSINSFLMKVLMKFGAKRTEFPGIYVF